MSDHVSECGATCGAKKMCCGLPGCVNEQRAVVVRVFFVSERQL